MRLRTALLQLEACARRPAFQVLAKALPCGRRLERDIALTSPLAHINDYHTADLIVRSPVLRCDATAAQPSDRSIARDSALSAAVAARSSSGYRLHWWLRGRTVRV